MSTELTQGRVHKFGDNINTDLISPAQYMEYSNKIIAAHAMEGADPDFPQKVNTGDIVVAGANFGSGSSRETAPIALKGCGVSAVIAKFFARIFYRNCINIGLPAIICSEADKINDGDVIQVDIGCGIIKNLSNGEEYACEALGAEVRQILENGGLMGDLRKRFGNTEIKKES